MAGPIRISILANGSQASRAFRATGNDADRMGSKFSKAGRGLALAGGLAIATRGVYGLGKAAISAASDAQQSLGATETVFGKFSKRVVKDSNRAAEQYGLSANEYRNSANLIGSLFRNQGVATDQLAGKSKAMIGTAADLAATFGGPTSDAVAALGSAFKGEFDPLEKYGISLKQSTVNAEALRVANVKSTSEFDKLSTAQQTAAKQTATTNLIQKQSVKSAGAFARETGTLANQQQVLGAKFDDVKAKIGTAFLPILTDLTSYVSTRVIPVLDDFGGWLEDNRDEISSTASTITQAVLPVLKTFATSVQTVGGFVKDLPGPVKEFGAQAAVAALILPRLTGALNAVSSPIRSFGADMRSAETRTARLSQAARTLAGVGGLLAITEGAKSSNKVLGTLGTTAGAAALGFSVAGPWGAAAGAVGGLTYSLTQNVLESESATSATDTLAASQAEAEATAAAYRDTLNQTTGAVTRLTREKVLQKLQDDGLLSSARLLDISTRDLIGATLGQEGAMRRVNAASRGNTDVLRGLENQRLTQFIRENRAALQGQQRELRRNNIDLQTWGQALKGLPPRVQTEIRQLGATASMREIRALARQYNLNPRRLVTQIEAAGVEVTGRRVRGLQTNLEDLGDVDPSNRWLRQFARDLTSGRQQSVKGAGEVADGLKSGTSKARPDLGPFLNGLTEGIGSARGAASSGGYDVGANLKSGVISGFSGIADALANMAGGAVATAIATARAAGAIRSPSRKMMYVGSMLGKGLTVGMGNERRRVKQRGKDLVLSALAGVRNGRDGIRSSLERVTSLVTRTTEKQFKNDKKARAVTKARLKGLRDEYAALTRNGKAQDRITARLRNATDRLKQLKQTSADYAKSVRDNLVSYASVTNLDTAFNSDALLKALKGRLAKIQQFSSIMRDLIKRGLNQTTVDQLTQAGVEGGLAQALAIQQGGAAAVAEFNTVQGQINAAAGTLGNAAANDMYLAGIQAAQGLVNGLAAKSKALDRAAAVLARKLAAAVRKALGIKSPSRVFAELGKQTAMGLTVGLDAVNVKRAGVRLADSLTTGFGNPALTALAAAGATSPAPLKIEIRLSADQVDAISRGRAVRADLDAYEASGGRRRAA